MHWDGNVLVHSGWLRGDWPGHSAAALAWQSDGGCAGDGVRRLLVRERGRAWADSGVVGHNLSGVHWGRGCPGRVRRRRCRVWRSGRSLRVFDQVAAVDQLAGLSSWVCVGWVAAVATLAVVGAWSRASRGRVRCNSCRGAGAAAGSGAAAAGAVVNSSIGLRLRLTIASGGNASESEGGEGLHCF